MNGVLEIEARDTQYVLLVKLHLVYVGADFIETV